MADNDATTGEEEGGGVPGPTELAVSIVAGPEYEITDRLSAALEEVANAIAEAEADEVAGFSFNPGLTVGGAGDFAAPMGPDQFLKIGCVLRGTGCTCKGGSSYSSSARAAFPTSF